MEHEKRNMEIPNNHPIFSKIPKMKHSMGIKISTDVFQRDMGNLFEDLKYALVYNLLIILKQEYDDNMSKLETIFCMLWDYGVQLNAKKSFFC